jgi:hypothetical protein
MNWVFLRYKEPTLFASTLPKPHEPTLNPKLCQRACKSSPITAFQDGFRIAHAQKNKINLCFVDRLAQFENDKKIKAK